MASVKLGQTCQNPHILETRSRIDGFWVFLACSCINRAISINMSNTRQNP